MQRRRGFTLIEILVVIGILVLLTVIVVMAFRGNESQKVREAGRSAQASILGARDRALHAKEPRGIRITRDPSDDDIGTGFAYVQRLEPLAWGPSAISLERMDVNPPTGPDSNDVTIVHGVSNVGWDQVKQFFPSNPRIRIPAQTGNWYSFEVLTSGPYALTASNQYLHLLVPFIDSSGNPGMNVAFNTSSAYSSAEIDMGSELLPNHAAISLPSGVVIDLNNSSPAARGDIMFSPRGNVTGVVSAQGTIYLLLRDVRDVTEGINPSDVTAVQRDMMIVTLRPQTGHCAVYPTNPTDAVNNTTGAAGADNLADDLLSYAKLGSAAGG